MRNRHQVYRLIDDERDYQDSRWGTTHDSEHSPTEWLLFLQRYITLAIAIEGASKADNAAEQMGAIRKITAIGVAAMEQNDTPKRKMP